MKKIVFILIFLLINNVIYSKNTTFKCSNNNNYYNNTIYSNIIDIDNNCLLRKSYKSYKIKRIQKEPENLNILETIYKK